MAHPATPEPRISRRSCGALADDDDDDLLLLHRRIIPLEVVDVAVRDIIRWMIIIGVVVVTLARCCCCAADAPLLLIVANIGGLVGWLCGGGGLFICLLGCLLMM